ncbi:MAG: nicotinamide-nucleotide adenylyltransferase, partial [Candidatus Uhrbacteria bacterium]|nr:nicotinamide-nucleotide adenylyltransferase [Patescibacteria group bacterium]MBU1906646.1 nicotinamide-nucleotide adenylyltransferase [Patescibacteria group bacterium]
MGTCVFVGRFQPFHNGHLMVVKGMAKTCGKVIIVIGSAQESNTAKNPFTATERKDMIQRSLQDIDLIPQFDIDFREIEDMKDDGAWADAVIDACGDISIVWTGDEWTKKCFEDKGIEVKDIVEVPGISATMIRDKIKNGDEFWRDSVPEEVAKTISEIEGITRIKKIS